MSLTDLEQGLIDPAATLAREIVAPLAARWERERRIGHEGLAAGGLGLSFGCKARVAEVLAAAEFGFAMSLVNSHNVAAKLVRNATPSVAARYLPELMAGTRLGCTTLSEPSASK